MTDEEIVLNIVDDLIDTFVAKMPPEIMVTTRAPLLMYNATLHLLKRMCDVCNISKETLMKHIEAAWIDVEKVVLN